ncbi:ABC transporter substrate-binding protein [uncultured Litoreibacter sp.]|uniref:ABC transporter substrate-binding protein n=1 Tax=uncultured Litoreibacter sp. TaxID=1392394 RepID=UPI00260FA6FC|nr:ABC transporter substrate-binding protein [uncultured Litoreibacter sp.]
MRHSTLLSRILATTIAAATLHSAAYAQASGEAPDLATLVANSQLPPVAERVGSDPEVIDYGEIGTYGGTVRFGINGSGDSESIRQMIGANGLVRWDLDLQTIIPNVVKSYEISDDVTTYTFHMREGMKWSDGEPLTTDDIAFNVNDLLENDDWDENGGSRMKSAKGRFGLEVIDKYTFKIVFPSPNGDFLGGMSRHNGIHLISHAKHYCKQFHPKYNDNIQADMTAAGVDNWPQLMRNNCGEGTGATRWANPERPSLEPWIIEEPLDGGATKVTFNRNPYFWKVDAEGNQLPYIDRMEGRVFQDAQAMTLAAIGGNFDFQFRGIDTASNRPVLAANREKGGYSLYEVTGVGGNIAWIEPNLNHPDPVVRDLMNEIDFRVAMSIGTNREEIINTALLGAGEPWHTGPFPGNPLYHEGVATGNLKYDPDRANALLDGLGLTDRDADGIRLMSDGRPARFLIDVAASSLVSVIDITEMMSNQWKNIGIDLRVNVVDLTLHEARAESAEHDFTVAFSGATWMAGQTPKAIIAISGNTFAPHWGDWHKSGGRKGEEPPQYMKEAYQAWADVAEAGSTEERVAAYHRIADIAAEHQFGFGISKHVSTYGVKKNGLENVLPNMKATSQFPSPANVYMPEAWYWSK